MKVSYKGYELEVKREGCLGGWSQVYMTIYRESDGLECECDFEDSEETVREKIKHLKWRVDNELESDDPWDEKATEARFKGLGVYTSSTVDDVKEK